MNRLIRLIIIIFALIGFIFPVIASGGMEDVTEGNKAYTLGDYKEALASYERSEVTNPESDVIAFNKGTVYFRLEDYDKAKEAFQDAAIKTGDLAMEALANYNLGNVSFMSAGRQLDGDLKKASELYFESIGFYKRALELDPDIPDASHNIEVTRLILKDLLDKLKEQQQQQQEQQEKIKEIVEKLAKLAEQEDLLTGHTTTLEEEKQKQGITSTLRSTAGKLRGEQVTIRQETGVVITDLDELQAGQMSGAPPGQQQPPQQGQQQPPTEQDGPVKEAKTHVTRAINFQQLVEKKLNSLELPGAVSGGEGARDELIKAIEALTESQDQNQEQQEQEDQEQQEQEEKEQKEEARDIIEEEREEQEEREKQRASGYYAPLKDW